MNAAEKLIARNASSQPELLILAESLSLAVRIEPALVRQMRLLVLPESRARLEAQFWHSPLVHQRTAEWLLMRPALCELLRTRLAARLGKSSDALAEVRACVSLVHEHIAAQIRLEEEIIWLGVQDAPGAKERIDQRLTELLRQVTQDTEYGRSLVRWFGAAAQRLPPLARETNAFGLLSFVVSVTLGARRVGRTDFHQPGLMETLPRLFQSALRDAPRTELWAALTPEGLAISPTQRRGYLRIKLPASDPMPVALGFDRIPSDDEQVVALANGEERLIETGARDVSLRTAAGDTYRFIAADSDEETSKSGGRAFDWGPPDAGRAARMMLFIQDPSLLEPVLYREVARWQDSDMDAAIRKHADSLSGSEWKFQPNPFAQATKIPARRNPRADAAETGLLIEIARTRVHDPAHPEEQRAEDADRTEPPAHVRHKRLAPPWTTLSWPSSIGSWAVCPGWPPGTRASIPRKPQP